MALSDEDRKRIEEEETFRAEARLRGETAARAKLLEEQEDNRRVQEAYQQKLRQQEEQQRLEADERERRHQLAIELENKRVRQARSRNGWLGLIGAIAVIFLLGRACSIANRNDRTTNTTSTNLSNPNTTSNSSLSSPVENVTINFTSDPSGAAVKIDGVHRGQTPVDIEVEKGKVINYTIEPEEPYKEYSLYKPYSGTFSAKKDEAIDIWVERTTAEEQEIQKAKYEAEAVIKKRRELENIVRSSPWTHVETQDAISDADASFIVSQAISTPSILTEESSLYIRCDKKDIYSAHGIAIVISVDDYLNSEPTPVDYRFDEEPSTQGEYWGVSTDGDAVFVKASKIPGFVNSLRNSTQLTIRAYDFRGSSEGLYIFDVRNTAEALELLGCYTGP
jgi:PEGA domain